MDEELRRLISDGHLDLTVTNPVPGRVTLTVSDGSIVRSFGPSIEVDAMRNAAAWVRQQLRLRAARDDRRRAPQQFAH